MLKAGRSACTAITTTTLTTTTHVSLSGAAFKRTVCPYHHLLQASLLISTPPSRLSYS